MGKILVIDDNERHVDIMCAMLVGAGLATEPCQCGRDALVRLARSPYDAIILDLLMPEVDGFDILQALQGGANHRTPVVVVTANMDLARRDLGLTRQVAAMLEKPVHTRDLLSAAYLALSARAFMQQSRTQATATSV